MGLTPRDRLIVALDLASPAEAERLVGRLGDAVGFYKISYQLAYAGGLSLAPRLAAAGRMICAALEREPASRVARALAARTNEWEVQEPQVPGG